jgi:hypothetical protein
MIDLASAVLGDVVVHVWDDPDGIPTPVLSGAGSKTRIPAAEIRRRSREWQWKNLDTPGWTMLITPNSIIRGDVSVEDLRSIGVHVEEFNVMMRTAIGGPKAGRIFSNRIFRDKSDFCRFATICQAANAESFYDPRTNEVAAWFDRPDARWFQKILAHEIAHAYMDLVWNRTDPLWFAEGMAEYFSENEWVSDGFRPGLVNKNVIGRLTVPVGLETFFGFSRDEMYSQRYPLYYANAWSIVHFLMSRYPFTVIDLLEGMPSREIVPLELEWRDYVRALAA